jgi:hypothetical protein
MVNHPDGGGSMHLWNVGLVQQDYTALYPVRLSSHARRRQNFSSYTVLKYMFKKKGFYESELHWTRYETCGLSFDSV